MWRCYRLRWKVKIKTNNTASLSISDRPAHRQHTDHCYYGSVGKSILRTVMSFKSLWDTEHSVCFCGMIFSSSEICMPSPQDYRTTFSRLSKPSGRTVTESWFSLYNFLAKLLFALWSGVKQVLHFLQFVLRKRNASIRMYDCNKKKNTFATENILLHQLFRF